MLLHSVGSCSQVQLSRALVEHSVGALPAGVGWQEGAACTCLVLSWESVIWDSAFNSTVPSPLWTRFPAYAVGRGAPLLQNCGGSKLGASFWGFLQTQYRKL